VCVCVNGARADVAENCEPQGRQQAEPRGPTKTLAWLPSQGTLKGSDRRGNRDDEGGSPNQRIPTRGSQPTTGSVLDGEGPIRPKGCESNEGEFAVGQEIGTRTRGGREYVRRDGRARSRTRGRRKPPSATWQAAQCKEPSDDQRPVPQPGRDAQHFYIGTPRGIGRRGQRSDTAEVPRQTQQNTNAEVARFRQRLAQHLAQLRVAGEAASGSSKRATPSLPMDGPEKRRRGSEELRQGRGTRGLRCKLNAKVQSFTSSGHGYD